MVMAAGKINCTEADDARSAYLADASAPGYL
jgi:hypothetical protein